MTNPEIIDKSGMWNGQLTIFKSLPSTNRWILDNCADCANGDIVTALDQTSGRGRFERTWVTPPGKCLTLSTAIKQNDENDALAPYLSQAAALAVHQTIQNCGLNAMVKWPNDVIASNRKIAGILAERDPESGLIALGIGLNINITVEEIASIDLLQPATSMLIETGKTFEIEAVRSDLIKELEQKIEDLWLNGLQNTLKIWSEHDYLANRKITIETTDSRVEGHYQGLENDGKIRLIDDRGTPHSFWSGDVSISLS